MLSEHHEYTVRSAPVHGAMGAEAFPLRASAGRIAHQDEQRPAVEFSLFDIGSDPAAVGGTVKITRVLVLGSLSDEPSGSGETIRRASFGDHRSAPGFANNADQALSLRFLAGHLAQQFQRRGDGRHQHQNIRAEG